MPPTWDWKKDTTPFSSDDPQHPQLRRSGDQGLDQPAAVLRSE